MTDAAIDVIVPRTPEGMGFQVKVRATGRVFRIEPTRCPGQPRYWCFRIYRCTSAGMADSTERPWYGAGGMTRDELPGAVQAIRTDLEGWLAREEHHELRSWLFAGDEVVTVPAGPRTRAASSRRAVTEAADASDVPSGNTV